MIIRDMQDLLKRFMSNYEDDPVRLGKCDSPKTQLELFVPADCFPSEPTGERRTRLDELLSSYRQSLPTLIYQDDKGKKQILFDAGDDHFSLFEGTDDEALRLLIELNFPKPRWEPSQIAMSAVFMGLIPDPVRNGAVEGRYQAIRRAHWVFGVGTSTLERASQLYSKDKALARLVLEGELSIGAGLSQVEQTQAAEGFVELAVQEVEIEEPAEFEDELEQTEEEISEEVSVPVVLSKPRGKRSARTQKGMHDAKGKVVVEDATLFSDALAHFDTLEQHYETLLREHQAASRFFEAAVHSGMTVFLKNAIKQVKANRPYSVCKECCGVPSDDDAECVACSGRGYLRCGEKAFSEQAPVFA